MALHQTDAGSINEAMLALRLKTVFFVFVTVILSVPDGYAANSVAMYREWLTSPQGSSNLLTHRILPQLKREALQDLAVADLIELPSADLRTQILLGMGESGNSAYIPALLKAFTGNGPDQQAAAAEALGRLKATEAQKPFETYLNLERNWFLNPAISEAILIAAGRSGYRGFEAPGFKIITRELPGLPTASGMAVRLSNRAQLDRLCAAYFWMVGDLSLQKSYRDWLVSLFDSHAVRSSIAAAKSLGQAGDSNMTTVQSGRDYLTDLARNPQLSYDLRSFAAHALAAFVGEEAIEITRYAMAQTRLEVFRELGPKRIPLKTARSLVESGDDGFLAMGVLAMVAQPQSESLAFLKERLEKAAGLFERALLTYAVEELDSH